MMANSSILTTHESSMGGAQSNAKKIAQERILIDNFISIYQRLSKDNLHLLEQVYSHNIEFSDPLHRVLGLNALTHYFANLYANISSINFEIHQVIHQQGAATLIWTMTFRHAKLNAGAEITVDGVSVLALDSKIYQHQDFFDLGSMLYEHIPLIGSLVKLVKSKASK
ncbi:nuclear transport factor 2 family protein [Shewanella sp. MBTL60-007]|uniref:nuclear transport factor 2 family protein n=1 Tax=Shewanella sp. MBTL60-007 TaxID=2815911 RepID=UPI001BC647ED|nr:nuclear transport factor 2 family protein [Shewanella sp. MBTL60-007]GIU29625.1 hypothetical protein TUM3792_39580 [Shewanella sp. MBTL60-007]